MSKHTRLKCLILISITIVHCSGLSTDDDALEPNISNDSKHLTAEGLKDIIDILTTPKEANRSRLILGCPSEIRQKLAECKDQCTTIPCHLSELQNFLSACTSETTQTCLYSCDPLCQNGGTCNADQECDCTPEWIGDVCDIPEFCQTCGVANTVSRNGRRKNKRKNNKRKKNKKRPSTPNRIIGGVEVDPPRKYPWVVSVMRDDDQFCGGSILNKRWILTAAHCLDETINGMEVTVGDHDLSTDSDDDSVNTKVYSVIQQVAHPDYDAGIDNNDFALLELDSEISFNDVIRPVCLPEDNSKTYDGMEAIVSGWGRDESDSGSDILLETEVSIDADCPGFGDLPDAQLCAVSSQSKDACRGDSGGPLVVEEENKYTLVGVVSYGAFCNDGDTERSGVYARVSTVLEWIQETIVIGLCSV